MSRTFQPIVLEWDSFVVGLNVFDFQISISYHISILSVFAQILCFTSDNSIPYFTSIIKRAVCEIFSQCVREVSLASANSPDGRNAACAIVTAQAAFFSEGYFFDYCGAIFKGWPWRSALKNCGAVNLLRKVNRFIEKNWEKFWGNRSNTKRAKKG